MRQTFRFAMTPQPKERPRFNRNGRAWTPERTRTAQDALAEMLKMDGATIYSRGLGVGLTVIFGVPKPKTVRTPWPTSRPDLDQYVKLVMDAGNGVLWEDDAQIVKIEAHKTFAETPFIQIETTMVAPLHQQSLMDDIWSPDPTLLAVKSG